MGPARDGVSLSLVRPFTASAHETAAARETAAAHERKPMSTQRPAELSGELKNLLGTPVFITVATIQPDGSPQASPVWVTRDGNDVLFSTTVDRRKYKNLVRDPRVSVVVTSPESPYQYAEIRGSAEMTTEGGQELIDALSLKYTGKQYAEFNPQSAQDAERVVVRIHPRKIVGSL